MSFDVHCRLDVERATQGVGVGPGCFVVKNDIAPRASFMDPIDPVVVNWW